MSAMRFPKSIIIAFILNTVVFVSLVMADCIQIPFSCFPREVQKKFTNAGKKLDLNGNDRTESSWGFIDNKGTHYDIITYNPVTIEELQQIQKIVMEK